MTVRLRCRRMPRLRALAALAAIVVAGTTLTGCAATQHVGTGSGTLKMGALAPTLTNNFNFLTSTNNITPVGVWLMYEPLIRYSPTNGYVPTPWLATSWDFSDGGKTLTWHLRHGVTWSDGQPLTSTDVAYTYATLATNPKLGHLGASGVTSATTPDPYTVVMHFAASAYGNMASFYGIPILPKHIWDKHDPANWTNPHPVGSGPYELSRTSLQQVVFTKRPGYWGPADHGVKSVVYRTYGTTNAMLQALLTGQLDYAPTALPGNPQGTFVGQNPATNHYWLPAAGAGGGVLFNNAVAPTNDVNVRRALTDAVDAADLIKLTPAQYGAPANVTGFGEPAYTPWLAPQYRGVTVKQNIPAAKAALAAGGWTVVNGNLTKNGKSYPLTLTGQPTDPLPWFTALVDMWHTALGLKVGLSINVNNGNSGPEGKFQLYMGAGTIMPGHGVPGGLAFTVGAPTKIGTAAPTNFSRVDSPAARNLLAQMQATPPTDIAKQQSYAFQIEQLLVAGQWNLPLAPYSWQIAYSSEHWAGWPDEKHPDAVPEDGSGDFITMVLNLRPA
jgi:peptide/nickel transport system substrate-binding protein